MTEAQQSPGRRAVIGLAAILPAAAWLPDLSAALAGIMTDEESTMTDHVRTLQALTLAGAERLADLALRAAAEAGAQICVAVTDPSGHLLAFRRMDGAGIVSIDVAIGKARTAAMFRKPVDAFEEMINSGHPSMLAVPGAVMLAGGLPVGTPVVGAIGISGSTGPGDLAIARAALAAFEAEI
ncbi:heme-binding protein [Poseidonocella sp. HB161398]|uniref:GlcG/HbpS family heme-binding protein n=1 Tax=Poseidonocella sp. HB161398 TaxID=2320855 RepID=UPI0011097643|nr:heme-binding protein [Poseidonocella sp. HB161398]